MSPHTFALEAYALRSYNYYERLVDRDGLPYFNVFWTEPAEAAHDWPDFGDVMARQLQAAIMARHMTGVKTPIEDTWYRKLLSYIDHETGIYRRPVTSFSPETDALVGDGSLILYALATAYLDNGDADLRRIITRMVDAFLVAAEQAALDGHGSFGGFPIKSLMACARHLDYEPALEVARRLVQAQFHDAPAFAPDNTFRHGGHMHGNLRTLSGAADYALYVNDPVLYSRVDALYRYVRSEATRFGFMPEVIGRRGDVVACETCALMDYAALAATLANHGHPEYWGDVERLARNHLVESQVADASWLHSDNSREDTEQFTWRDIGERVIGAYAGWSSPNHILACRENLHWGGPELRGKTRALQNCCGGSGTHALFIIWKNAARFEDGCLSINMHIDKRLPQAEIRCFQPYQGRLTVKLDVPCRVRMRIPEFVSADETRLTANGTKLQGRAWGNYVELDEQPAGTLIEMAYPLPIRDEEISIGNPGFRQYRYRVTWKGDTVIKMQPLGNEFATGYSDFENAEAEVFYGEAGPGPLYRRDHMLVDAEPAPSTIHPDDGALDLWRFSAPSR